MIKKKNTIEKKKILKLVSCCIILVVVMIGITKLELLKSEEETMNIQQENKEIKEAKDAIEDINTNYIITNNHEDYQVMNQNSIIPHIDEDTQTKYVTYEDFGAYADGINDDYPAIKQAHDLANQYKCEVRAEKKTYHIYKKDSIEPVEIKTDTNWNGAKFIIHDEEIAGLETAQYSIFQITPRERTIRIEEKDRLENITINAETSRIEELGGYGNCYVHVYNEQKTQFIRSGTNENIGKPQQDIFRIDNEGNVLNKIQHDFDNISKIILIPMEEEITIENGEFETKLSTLNQKQTAEEYLKRNMVCIRSNVIIRNINHYLSNDEIVGGAYYGFISIANAANIKIENCKLSAHKYDTISSYDLILENCCNVQMNNVTSEDIDNTTKWGITGSNYTKDINYKNCILNRIDAHCGVYNLNVENCQIGAYGINVVGGGELNVLNTTCSKYNGLIFLRSDYGSTWNGEINIKNCRLTNLMKPEIISFNIIYDKDNSLHDYGYDLYLPNVTIDGLTIDDKNINNSYDNLYVFHNSREKTGKENGDMKDNYHLPQNIMVKDYETTSERKLKLFSNKFYNNLEELGINLSMPLADKKGVEITNNQQEKIGNDSIITNSEIQIAYEEVEGIETIVKINNEIIRKNEVLLDKNGNYEVQITYQNTAGESETENRKITIDKTPPSITGIESGKLYTQKVIPEIRDENLQKVELLLNGKKVDNYVIGGEIQDEGLYQIIATDKAGNTTTINFQMIENKEDNYQIEEKLIKNIANNTKIIDFNKKIDWKLKYDIYRNNKKLGSDSIVATGDILKTSEGNSYTLIVAGDINKDGLVNIKDIVKMRKYLLERNNLDEMEVLAADTNLDGKSINIKDLIRMRILTLDRNNIK